MTLTVTENKIVSDVRTKGPNGTETGSSIISLSIDKMPESVTVGQKIDMIATWDISTSGTPRYTSSAVELRRGEFSGKSTPIRSEQNPTGSLTFTWSPGGDEFEVTARLTVRGDAGRIKWIYRLEK